MVSEEARLAQLGRYIDRVLDGLPDPCNPEQLAKAVNRTPRSIRKACGDGELPAVVVGKRWQITHEGIRLWLTQATLEGLAS